MLDELDTIELETTELDIDDEAELELEIRVTLLLVVVPYCGGARTDELLPGALLDTPGYTGAPANLTAVVTFPALKYMGVGLK